MKIVSLTTAKAAITLANELIEEDPCIENLDAAASIVNSVYSFIINSSYETKIEGKDILNNASKVIQTSNQYMRDYIDNLKGGNKND